jgi:hypothetical protein
MDHASRQDIRRQLRQAARQITQVAHRLTARFVPLDDRPRAETTGRPWLMHGLSSGKLWVMGPDGQWQEAEPSCHEACALIRIGRDRGRG